MYVSRRETRVIAGAEDGLIATSKSLHADMRTKAGFRWAMLLRSLAEPEKFVALSMWQAQPQAESALSGASGEPLTEAAKDYDVATARGSMTPCAFAAIVDWSIEAGDRPGFVNRWNAEFHHLEDRMGSRLLQDLGQTELLAGLHVANADGQLQPTTLSIEIKNSKGVAVLPSAIDCYEVVLLSEA